MPDLRRRIRPDGKEPIDGIVAGSPPRPTIRLSTIGMTAGDYHAVMLNEGGVQIARTRFAVVPADGHASIQVTAAVKPGSGIPVTFLGASGVKLDRVGTYRKGDPSVCNDLGFAYTGARINGTLTFPAAKLYEELGPDDYEARLMADDNYQVKAVAAFTVVGP